MQTKREEEFLEENEELKTTLDRLAEFYTGACRDALRYRWCRLNGAWESEIRMDELAENPENYDARVDELMKQGRDW